MPKIFTEIVNFLSEDQIGDSVDMDFLYNNSSARANIDCELVKIICKEMKIPDLTRLKGEHSFVKVKGRYFIVTEIWHKHKTEVEAPQ